MDRDDDEQLVFEIEFFESVLEKDPDNEGALQVLGCNYTYVGRHEDGLRVDMRLAVLLPDDPVVQYNLACSCSLTGRLDESLRALKRSVDLGYEDFEYMRSDPDLSAVRETSAFGSVLETRDVL